MSKVKELRFFSTSTKVTEFKCYNNDTSTSLYRSNSLEWHENYRGKLTLKLVEDPKKDTYEIIGDSIKLKDLDISDVNELYLLLRAHLKFNKEEFIKYTIK
jgi:hypothetical protein